MSLPDDNLQLRKLARAVMRGELDRAEYQKQRRALIDSYTGHAGAADDTDLTDPGNVPVLHVEPAPADLPPAASTVPNQPALPTPARADLWIGLVAVIAVVLVVVGLLAYYW